MSNDVEIPLRQQRRSVSQLTSYSACSEAYRLERVEKAPRRPAAWTIQGTAAHAAIEEWENSGRTTGRKALEDLYLTTYRTEANRLLESNELSVWMTGGFKKAENDLTDREALGWWQVCDYQEYAHSEKDLWEVAASEVEFNIEIATVKVTGFIDQVRRCKVSGRLEPADLKGLTLDTPLATPDGWTTMADVSVGDEVLGANGTPVRVVAKSGVKNMRVFRVHFSDGEHVDCDEEHLWEVFTHMNPEPVVVDVLKLAELVQRRPAQKVRLPDPVQLSDVELPIDPYVLGAWLADGNRNNGCFTKGTSGIASEIRALGYEVSEWRKTTEQKAQEYNILKLLPILKREGLYRNKHVPKPYLRGSAEQRWSLLQGLMDGDGSWHKSRREAVFYNTDPALADAVYELALLAGEKPVRGSHSTTGFGKTVTCYTVKWQPARLNPFRASPKADLAVIEPRPANGCRFVRRVEEIESTETACIAVDAEDHLYLAGSAMIPTHNTGAKIPAFPGQLAVYRHAMSLHYPDDTIAEKGYWIHLGKSPTEKVKARHCKAIEVDLSDWPIERMSRWLVDMDASEKLGIYLPNPQESCTRVCGVSQWCRAVGAHYPSVQQYEPSNKE